MVTDTTQGAESRLAIVAALVFGLQNDALENHGGIQEVHAVFLKVAKSFWLIPFDAHLS